MRALVSIACIFISWAMPAAMAADLAALCQQDIEGTYLSRLPGGSTFQCNLFCLAPGRIMASVSNSSTIDGQAASMNWANLSVSSIDDDDLILANFLIGDDDRRTGSSKSTMAYARLSVAALQGGRLEGQYIGKSLSGFLGLHGRRSEKYPQFLPVLATPLSKNAARGMYVISNGSLAGGTVTFDILANTPVVSIAASDAILRLDDGLAWDGSGVFSIATPEGNGGEADDRYLNFMRGHFVDPDTMEFILVVPSVGLQGPFSARRSKLDFLAPAISPSPLRGFREPKRP